MKITQFSILTNQQMITAYHRNYHQYEHVRSSTDTITTAAPATLLPVPQTSHSPPHNWWLIMCQVELLFPHMDKETEAWGGWVKKQVTQLTKGGLRKEVIQSYSPLLSSDPSLLLPRAEVKERIFLSQRGWTLICSTAGHCMALQSQWAGFQKDMMLQCKPMGPFPPYLIPNSYSLANPLFQKSWRKTYLLETTFLGENPAMILDLTPVHVCHMRGGIQLGHWVIKTGYIFSTYLVSRSLKFITWRHESSIKLTWFTFYSILKMGSKAIASNQMIPFSWVSSADLIRI